MSTKEGQIVTVCGNSLRLVELLGNGSFGRVYKGINLKSGVAVAVKVVAKARLGTPHERQSIEKEIETMRLAVENYENGHPHIVRLLCTKESVDEIFIVLEYCAGGDISTLIKSKNGLSEEEARCFMAQLASGLQFLRSTNVIHRDLKPANLLLSSVNPATTELKIADFGFARKLQNAHSMAETVVGSPLYMAPELFQGNGYDAKADLWSVGIILFEMVTNEHPFLLVDNVQAINFIGLEKNIHRYFQLYPNGVEVPKSISVSPQCQEFIKSLLKIKPEDRISFEDFFKADFLLPPTPNSEMEVVVDCNSTCPTKNPLIDKTREDSTDWTRLSDEYVLVEIEYEDIGREVLAEKETKKKQVVIEKQDDKLEIVEEFPKSLPNADLPPPPTYEETMNKSVVTDAVVADARTEISASSPKKKEKKKISFSPCVEETTITKSDNSNNKNTITWVDDRSQMEELLGICYKSFEIGSIALFVPTPNGDYLAFHEDCPHYYLSKESLLVACSSSSQQKPPYVLGHIVIIEDLVATASLNPYKIALGAEYHSVTVSALSNSGEGFLSTNNGGGNIDLISSSSNPSSNQSLINSKKPKSSSFNYHQRISFRSFQINFLALFLQRHGKMQYVAFNEGCPHYYLSEESVAAAKADSDKYPAYICGEIIYIESFQATEDFNPHRLEYGTRFHVVTVLT